MPQIYVTKSTRQRKHKDGSNAPQPKCETCGKTIEVGMPHKNVSVRSGSFSQVFVRCMDEPDWHIWELSSSLSARLEEVSYNFHAALSDGAFETVDDVRGALEEAANSIREIAEEKRESATNIEEGFQHATYQSDELNDQADNLESWADEIESVDVPDLPELEEQDCDGGSDHTDPLCICSGTGRVTPEELSDEAMEEWRAEVEDVISIVDESPV